MAGTLIQAKNWHNRAPASGEYTITPEDGRVNVTLMDKRTNIKCKAILVQIFVNNAVTPHY
jgi:hypothetical protein